MTHITYTGDQHEKQTTTKTNSNYSVAKNRDIGLFLKLK